MAKTRPFTDINQITQAAQHIWQQCHEPDFLIAFEAHPMIGDVNSLRAKYAATKNMASNEQQGASQAERTDIASSSRR